jgi:hypothetical protein
MNATPLLVRLHRALADEKLEVVLIGNAAAAIHGAPVTTLDVDFIFRETPGNMRKLKGVAAALGATILRPYYPVSRLYRMTHDSSGLQADFMPIIHGVRSFEGLKTRAVTREIGGQAVLVASLDDIIKSKRAAGRPGPGSGGASRARGASPHARGRCRETAGQATPQTRAITMPRAQDNRRKTAAGGRRRQPARAAALAALRGESQRQLQDLIRRRLALPFEERMNFLRRRLPGGGSCL